MNTLLKRSLTGLVFVIVMLSGTLFSDKSYQILFWIIITGCILEFYELQSKIQPINNIPKWILIVIGSQIIRESDLINLTDYYSVISIVSVICMLFFITQIYIKTQIKNNSWTAFFFGLFYIVLPFSLLYPIINYDGDSNRYLIVLILLLVWSNDTFAYLVGSAIGKHKLFESISPKKTWEGAIGGAVCTMGLGYFLPTWLPISLTAIDTIIIALIVSVFGSYGDLFESTLKRAANVKDSGNILPGHGGFLDRFDAFIFVLPFISFYIFFIKRIL